METLHSAEYWETVQCGSLITYCVGRSSSAGHGVTDTDALPFHEFRVLPFQVYGLLSTNHLDVSTFELVEHKQAQPSHK
jgi:hypothetical protein